MVKGIDCCVSTAENDWHGNKYMISEMQQLKICFQDDDSFEEILSNPII